MSFGNQDPNAYTIKRHIKNEVQNIKVLKKRPSLNSDTKGTELEAFPSGYTYSLELTDAYSGAIFFKTLAASALRLDLMRNPGDSGKK